jgi:hypothetical protein
MRDRMSDAVEAGGLKRLESLRLIDVAFVAFVALELFDVFARLLDGLAAPFENDLAQRGIHILGHPARVAANEKLPAFAIDPFPNFRRVLQHAVLHINLMGLVARPGAVESREKAVAF